MTELDLRHRPLVCGLRVQIVHIYEDGNSRGVETGTLTGLVTRTSGNKSKVLITNWHVVTGGSSQRLPFDPGMHETVQLHQPVKETSDDGTSNEVGTLSDWSDLSLSCVNFVDAAEFEIAEDVAAAHIPCKPASLATHPNSSPSPDPPTPYTLCSSQLRTPGPLYRLLPFPTHPPTQDARTPSATRRR